MLGRTVMQPSDNDGEFTPCFLDQVATFADRGSADAIAGILEGERVRTKVEAYGLLAGTAAGYRVLVDPRQLRRALWILQQGDLTDGELSYLATGQLGEEPSE
jgi:hypothetical protein